MNLRIFKSPEGQYVASVSFLGADFAIVQSGISNGEQAAAILDALANGTKINLDLCSWKVRAILEKKFPKVYGPKTKLQHRKIFKDDTVDSPHAKWHDLDELDCSHDEREAREVIANGGIVQGGYCLNMFREVPA